MMNLAEINLMDNFKPMSQSNRHRKPKGIVIPANITSEWPPPLRTPNERIHTDK